MTYQSINDSSAHMLQLDSELFRTSEELIFQQINKSILTDILDAKISIYESGVLIPSIIATAILSQ